MFDTFSDYWFHIRCCYMAQKSYHWWWCSFKNSPSHSKTSWVITTVLSLITSLTICIHIYIYIYIYKVINLTYLCSDGTIPCMTIILGGNLIQGKIIGRFWAKSHNTHIPKITTYNISFVPSFTPSCDLKPYTMVQIDQVYVLRQSNRWLFLE